MALILGAAVLAGVAACGDNPAGTRSPTSPATARASATVAATQRTAIPATATTTEAPAVTPTTPAAPTSTPEPSGDPAAVVRSVDAGNAVVLTFDAGSDVGYTQMILDVLAAEGVRASFGITGAWAEKNPEIVRHIAAAGHHFVNHSYDHGSFTGFSDGRPTLTREQRWAQIDDTEAIVQELTGMSTKPYFRPPYGDYDDSVNEDVGARGYRYNLMWVVDSFGWRGISADEIVARCLQLAQPGAIYIFHVGSSSQDGPALGAVIDGLRAAGYSFAYLPDVLP